MSDGTVKIVIQLAVVQKFTGAAAGVVELLQYSVKFDDSGFYIRRTERVGKL